MEEERPSNLEKNPAVAHDNDESIDILVVEDDDIQRKSIVAVLRACLLEAKIANVSGGDDALDFLLGRGAWINRAKEIPPKLVLLDLAMPGGDGFSVLTQIRTKESEEAITLTPMVIFSDSQEPNDIRYSYRCGANVYVIKPLSYRDFEAIVKSVGQYWMSINTAVT